MVRNNATIQSIAHLWNVSKFFEKSQNPEVMKLRTHFMYCCRELEDRMELPKQNFGPSVMCTLCGSLWTIPKHKIRISPKKTPRRCMENLIRQTNESSSKMPKSICTLTQKCEKNKQNKLTRICTICSQRTTLVLNKQKRRKFLKKNPVEDETITMSSKKKKKRVRDKTAGLNLSGLQSPKINQMDNIAHGKNQASSALIEKSKLSKLKNQAPISKCQKLNLSKLKGMINVNVTPSKKSKLHTFLKDFC